MIAKDKHYFYKGNEYVVVGFTKMKSTLDGTWVEAVQYKRATEVDDPNIEPFTREKSDFEYKFIPAVLEVDMEIVAVSMGKLVAEYKVTEVGEDNAAAISPSDVELVVSKNVSSNGEVTKVSGGVGYTAEYYVMMPDMKKRVSNRTITPTWLQLYPKELQGFNKSVQAPRLMTFNQLKHLLTKLCK